MQNDSKRKLLSVTILFTILLSSGTYAVLVPNVHAAEASVQEKGRSFLSNVAGVDLAKYNVATEENSQYLPFLGAVLQENVLYTLTSANSKLKAFCTFANGNFQGVYVLEKEGTPSLTSPPISANAVERAQSFLSNYQAYAAKPVLGQLISTLNGIDASKNLTKTVGDKVLEVTAYGDGAHFKWYYTANGAIAPYSKVVAIGFKDGFLHSFIDNWNLYSIGSTSVNLSKEEAVAIALDTARKHSWTMQLNEDTLDPRNFNEKRSVSWTALVFDGSLDANKTRSEDVLELYPVWRVGLVLNKVFGELYGLEVDIWADTKEVRSVQEEYSDLAAQLFENNTANVDTSAEAANQSLHEIANIPSSGLSNQTSDEDQASISNDQTFVNGAEPNFAIEIMVSATTVSIIGAFAAGLFRKKPRALSRLKPRSVKTFGILLGFLMLPVVFLPLVATANATTRAGNVWGSSSSGAPNYPYHSWRKTDDEIFQQWNTSTYILGDFYYNGYTAYNNEGRNKDDILYEADYFSDNYDYVAIVDFDHGVGNVLSPGEFHYMFEDDWGTLVGSPPGTPSLDHGVYDKDIYDVFPPAKVHFAFIDACMSARIDSSPIGPPLQDYPLVQGGGFNANGTAEGLPFAFTHRIVTYVSAGYSGTAMSDDGYSRPDAFPQCYIGFPFGSAALDQRIDRYGDYGTGPKWYIWVQNFFYEALNFDISVKQALDIASEAQWQCDGFYDSPLKSGFYAVWPPFDPKCGCTLAVYGNGNIHLKNFQPSDMVTWPSVSGPTLGDPYVSYDFSARAIDSHGHNIRYVFDWGDGSSHWTDYASNGEPVSVSHTWNSEGIFSVTVIAQCSDGVWSSWSSPHAINIGNVPPPPPVTHTLTVDSFDLVCYNEVNPDVYVNEEYAGTAPLEIEVPEGYIILEVDNYVWCSYCERDCLLYFISYGAYYGENNVFFNNVVEIPVESDTGVWLVYLSQY